MKNKAESLQEIARYLRQVISETDAHNEGNGTSIDVRLSLESDEARALVEALEGLRWANVYRRKNSNNFYLGFEDDNLEAVINSRLPEENFFETVGIIRLKSDEQ